MSIKNKLQLLQLFFVSTLLVVASIFIIELVDAKKHLNILDAATIKLDQMVRVSMNIGSQGSKVMNYMLGEKNAYKEFQAFTEKTKTLIANVVSASQTQVELEVDSELEDEIFANEVQDKYQSIVEDAEMIFAMVDGKNYAQAKEMYENKFLDIYEHELSKDISKFIQNERSEIDHSHNSFLVDLGSALWIKEKGILHVEQSRKLFEYYMTVNMVSTDLNFIVQNILSFVLFQEKERKEKILKLESEILADFAKLSKIMVLVEKDTTIAKGKIDEFGDDILEMKMLIKQIVYLVNNNEIEKAIDLREKKFEKLVRSEMFPDLISFLNDGSDAIKHEHSMLMSLISDSIMKYIATMLLLLSFSFYYIFKIIKNISDALSLIKEGAEAIGGGNLSYKIEYTSRDEIGKVAESFNHMATELLKSNDMVQKSHEMLKNSKEYTESILESMSDSLVVLSELGAIKRTNKAMSNLLQYGESNLKGKLISEFTKRGRFELIKDCTSDDQRNELVIITKNGVEKTVSYTLSCINDETGKAMESVCVLQDISKQKAIEKDHLTVKEAAIKADRAKSEFLANMSHEIRTPINGILGMAELISGTKLTEEQKEFTTAIKKSVESLLTIINDILDFSKIEAKKLDFENVPFSITEVFTEIYSMFAFQAKEKDLSFTCKTIGETFPLVKGDPVRLKQIIVNLASNAMKFTKNGQVSITATLLQYGKKGIKVAFEVKDTGIGISEEQKSNLFRPFSQADSSTTRLFGGTGLGLVIAKNLAFMMGGGIKLESSTNEGSTFSFSINFIEPTKEEIESYQNKFKIELFPDNNYLNKKLTGLSVLLAEDNLINQKMMIAMLGKMGIRTHVAPDGGSVLEILKKDTFDIILMDCQMPVMDGYEATRIICETYKERPIIIALTANALISDKQLCLDAGMDDYLSKPVKLTVLKETLKKWVNVKKKKVV